MTRLPVPGDQIYLDGSDKPLQVYSMRELGGQIHLGVISSHDRQARDFVLTHDEIAARMTRVPGLAERFSTRKSWLQRDEFILAIEALRIRLAYLFDPFHALNVHQVDFLPHQVEAVYHRIIPSPELRFLLADDPGLGKTIMAGLVLAELKARGLVHHCLIVTPAHLQEQWKRELHERFQEDFDVLDRTSFGHANTLRNYLERHPQVIASMDFAKQPKVRKFLTDRETGKNWDIVIVDEAHKLSATRYGREIRKTRRYQLGEALAPCADRLLFLTATPHKGDDTAYWQLVDLLQPRLFAHESHLRKVARDGTGLDFVLRRAKEQVTDLEGRPLFKERTVETVSLEMTGAERVLYERVTAYVRRWYRVLGPDVRSRQNIALALTMLQRRATSSLYSIRRSLYRRRQKLQELRQTWQKSQEQGDLPAGPEVEAEIEDQSAADWEDLQSRLEGLTAARTLSELDEELREIDRLVKFARNAESTGEEGKLEELRRVANDHLRHQPNEKLLVFSEFRDTVMNLKNTLEGWGFTIAVIHGGLDMRRRIEQERVFREQAQVMVATDAAAEGINLQFCRLMINYDLPWNPNRLEQRMGRIHRYGQKRECFIWNVLYSDTREGDVLSRVLEKLQRMRARPELGDTIYDVISVVLEGVRLENLIMKAIVTGDMTEIDRIIERDIDRRFDGLTKVLRENALAEHRLDLSPIRREGETSRRQQLVPWDIEFFTRLAIARIGGRIQPVSRQAGVFKLGIPRRVQANFRHTDYVPGLKIAFDRARAREADVTFLAPGHPILEKMIERFIRHGERPRITTLVDSHGKSGSLWFYRAKVIDGNDQSVEERLLTLFRSDDGAVASVDPRWVRNLKSATADPSASTALFDRIDAVQNEMLAKVTAQLKPVRAEVAMRRQRDIEIKRRSLGQSYQHLIFESCRRLADYRIEQIQGKDMQLPMRQEARNRDGLVEDWTQRSGELDREGNLTLLKPELEAVAIVLPVFPGGQATTDVRQQVELAGMAESVRYEKMNGREPIDVSAKMLGYDIKSSDSGETRYIEVKAFTTSGPLELTPHEWQMARRLDQDYWLYIVEDATTSPKLTPVRNPADVLQADAQYGITGFSIQDWRTQIADCLTEN